MKKICYKITFMVVFLLGVAFCGVVFSDDTFAGGWISGDAGESSYDGGPGGEWHNCSNIGGSYLLECTGFSWVFYKSTGNIESSIYFRPDLSSNKIDKVCSEHTDQNGGFWHFGRNARGISGGGYNKQGRWQTFNYFGDFDYVNNYYDTNARVTYSTGAGNWGHMETLNYRLYGSYGSSYYKTPTSLNHTIYVDGEAIYNAQKYGTISQVLSDYKKAYKYVTGSDYTGNSLPGDMYAFCYWDDMAGSTFEGDSGVMEVSENNPNIGWQSVPENKRRFVGWKSTNAAASTYVVNDCDPVDGCLVSFRHYLKRTSGSGSTKYSVTRDLGNNISETTWNFTKTNEGENVTTNPVRMYPGQKVCETLNFYTKSSSDGSTSDRVSTTVCAAAVATVGADIDIQIRDQQSSDRYNEYGKSDIVYAKPNDTVNIKGSYFPKYQSLYNTVLPRDAIVNGRKISNNNGTKIGNMFSLYTNPAWNNAFSINLFNDEKDLGKNCNDGNYYNGTVGSADQYDGVTDYQVMHNDVGKTKKAKAVTNICEPVKNTPKQVSLTYSDSASFTANVDVGDKRSKEVSIAVPYNFSNSTEITNAQDSVVYAGEAASINYNITVGTKNNSETNGEYATPVPGAEWGLSMSYDGGATWNDVELGRGDLNSGNEYKFEGGKESKGGIEGKTVNIPDLPAGTVIYFRSWVTPGDSGGPINMDVDKFSGKVYSKEVSFIVAKRPSFQVWGGSVYSANNVESSMSAKNNLADEVDYLYKMTGGDKVRVFGSWAELSLIAEGEVRGLASGAGLGYGTTTDAGNASQQKTIETLGGRNSSDYCLMSTLSIANSNCNSAGVGNLGRSSGRSGDKSSLISDFVQEGDQFNIEGEFSLSGVDDNRKTDKGVYYYDGKNKKLSMFESAIGAGVTKVVRTNNDIDILGNIVYQNEGYSDLESIPKIIIYAKNINISCSVTRIDAVLIADEKINTCSDNITDNSSLRSTPLMINGSVISNTLTLGRTYGAATGKNSVIPAEIINYDTSLYLWANNQSSATTSGKLTETYINELAPRY